jgi:hypothetical protein
MDPAIAVIAAAGLEGGVVVARLGEVAPRRR